MSRLIDLPRVCGDSQCQVVGRGMRGLSPANNEEAAGSLLLQSSAVWPKLAAKRGGTGGKSTVTSVTCRGGKMPWRPGITISRAFHLSLQLVSRSLQLSFGLFPTYRPGRGCMIRGRSYRLPTSLCGTHLFAQPGCGCLELRGHLSQPFTSNMVNKARSRSTGLFSDPSLGIPGSSQDRCQNAPYSNWMQPDSPISAPLWMSLQRTKL